MTERKFSQKSQNLNKKVKKIDRKRWKIETENLVNIKIAENTE
jgi:hypothetical protein